MRFNHAGLTASGLTILRLTRGARRLTPDYTRLKPALMLLRKIYHALSGALPGHPGLYGRPKGALSGSPAAPRPRSATENTDVLGRNLRPAPGPAALRHRAPRALAAA